MITAEDHDELLKRIKNIEMALFGKCDNYWHEIDTLSDGAMIGTIGSMTHIIDPETKTPMSRGYHKIKVGFPRHIYIGTIGAKTENFTVISD